MLCFSYKIKNNLQKHISSVVKNTFKKYLKYNLKIVKNTICIPIPGKYFNKSEIILKSIITRKKTLLSNNQQNLATKKYGNYKKKKIQII